MLFRLPFVTLVFGLAAFGTPVKRDAAQVESDVQNVRTESVALDNAVKAFSNSDGTFSEAFSIHTDATRLSGLIKTATSDTSASPAFTEAQSEAIIELVNDVVTVVQSGSQDLVAKKPGLTAVGAGGLAESDLKTLKSNTDELGNALLAKLPLDAQASAEKAINNIDAALTFAINAFT